MYLKEEVQTLQKSQTLEESAKNETTAKISRISAELKGLNDQYANRKQWLWQLEASCPFGYVREAFEICRKDPN